MYNNKMIWFGNAGTEKICIQPSMANRHGLIAGATGTGKTTTLRVLAESFSDCGVPVFLADVKGDLATMCHAGSSEGFVGKRVEEMGLEAEGFTYHGCPVTYWDVYGEGGLPLRMTVDDVMTENAGSETDGSNRTDGGLPLRTTISEMGPLLLSRILGLNSTQTDVLTVIFKIADDEGLLLIDTKDLRAMLTHVGDNAKEYSLTYGNMAKATLAAIIRAVIALEGEGGDKFFGEPAVNIKRDWIRKDEDGKGMINILDCRKLVNNPTMYSSFLLWMLSEMYENLPEVGDMPKPRLVFFFDEAHLLFETASKPLMTKIEQVVKLIRSKGVGIYFVTQSPKDVPDGVLAQLGNKIQHAMHAYTPAEQKAVKAAASSFRANPEFDTYDTILNMGTGEAIASVLDAKGVPTIVQKCVILPPQCGMGDLPDEERRKMILQSDLYTTYDEAIDRDSAYEFLQRKNLEDAEAAKAAAEAAAAEKERLKAEAEAEKAKQKAEAAAEKQKAKEEAAALKEQQKAEAAAQKAAEKAAAAAEKQRLKEEAAAQKEAEKAAEAKKKTVSKIAKSVATTAGGTVGREVGNTLGKTVGGTFGKKLGGNIGASLGRGILGGLFGK